jgi:hypothetical protein
VASDDYVPEEWESTWLPDVDVREVIGDLPPASVDLDDPAWDDALPECDLPKVRAAVRGLGDPDRSVVEKSVTTLWRLVCGYENTSVVGALVVPSLLRAPAHVGSVLCAGMLQLAGNLARVPNLSQDEREGLLRTMEPTPVYDSYGYLENWSVEAVRAMVGRDSDLLTALMRDDSPAVRGLAAYVLAAAKPVTVDVIGVFRDRLAVETDPAVQMILVVCIAEHEKDRDRSAEALPWARALWSDPTASLGVRLGGVIAWFGLTLDDPPRELRALREAMPMTTIGPLLRQLPWIFALSDRPGATANWWHSLDATDSAAEEFPQQWLRRKLETTEPRALAEFYRELLGLYYRDGDEGADPLVLVDAAGVQALAVHHVAEAPPGSWPRPDGRMRFVCILRTEGPAELKRRRDQVESLGATLLRDGADSPDEPMHVFVDPGGHPFGVYAR